MSLGYQIPGLVLGAILLGFCSCLFAVVSLLTYGLDWHILVAGVPAGLAILLTAHAYKIITDGRYSWIGNNI